tara:strand:+ start:124 stop:297 length:174 start_codon:yes stop_codon:yes gene_type:complete
MRLFNSEFDVKGNRAISRFWTRKVYFFETFAAKILSKTGVKEKHSKSRDFIIFIQSF